MVCLSCILIAKKSLNNCTAVDPNLTTIIPSPTLPPSREYIQLLLRRYRRKSRERKGVQRSECTSRAPDDPPYNSNPNRPSTIDVIKPNPNPNNNTGLGCLCEDRVHNVYTEDPEQALPQSHEVLHTLHNPNPTREPQNKGTTVVSLLVAMALSSIARVYSTTRSYLDSGCTRDVLGGDHANKATNVTNVNVNMNTVNGNKHVSTAGDYEHSPGLVTRAGLIVKSLPFSREPKEWDGGPTDSPVASPSSIRSLLFMKGGSDDVKKLNQVAGVLQQGTHRARLGTCAAI